MAGSPVLTDYNLLHARKTDSTSPFTSSSSQKINFNSPTHVNANIQNVYLSITMNSYEISLVQKVF